MVTTRILRIHPLLTFLVLLAAVLLTPPGGNHCRAQDTELWDAGLKTMLERKERLVQELNAKQQNYLARPSFDNELAYNTARTRLAQFADDCTKTAKAIAEAKAASHTTIQGFVNTSTQVSDMLTSAFWAIAPDTTWLLGASEDELYGDNWKWAEERFKGVVQEARDIRQELRKLKDSPADAARAAELRTRAALVRQKLESLRKVYRAEQQNLGWKVRFWGDTMGRGIEACMDAFKWEDMLIGMINPSPKMAFDVLKPMIMENHGKAYMHPFRRDGCTALIASEVTVSILCADGDVSPIKKTWDEYLKKLAEQGMLAELMQRPEAVKIMYKMREGLAGSMEIQLARWLEKAPYGSIPTNLTPEAAAQLIAMNTELRDNIVRDYRDNYMTKKLTNADEALEQGAGELFGQFMDWAPEFADYYSKISMYRETMNQVADLCAGWRAEFRRLKEEGKLDANEFYSADVFADPEDSYVNARWAREDIGPVFVGFGKEPKVHQTTRETVTKVEKKREETEKRKESSGQFDEFLPPLRDAAEQLRGNAITTSGYATVYSVTNDAALDVYGKARAKLDENLAWLYQSHLRAPHPWKVVLRSGRHDDGTPWEESKYVGHWLTAEDPCTGQYRALTRQIEELQKRYQDYCRKAWEIHAQLVQDGRDCYGASVAPLLRDRQKLMVDLVDRSSYEYRNYYWKYVVSQPQACAAYFDAPYYESWQAHRDLQKDFPGFPGTLKPLVLSFRDFSFKRETRDVTMTDLDTLEKAFVENQRQFEQAVAQCTEDRERILRLAEDFEEHLQTLTAQLETAYDDNQGLLDLVFSRTQLNSWTRDYEYPFYGHVADVVAAWREQRNASKVDTTVVHAFDPADADGSLDNLRKMVEAYREVVRKCRDLEKCLDGNLSALELLFADYDSSHRADSALRGQVWCFMMDGWTTYATKIAGSTPAMPNRTWGDLKTLRPRIQAWMAALEQQSNMDSLPDELTRLKVAGEPFAKAEDKLEVAANDFAAAARTCGLQTVVYNRSERYSSYAYPTATCRVFDGAARARLLLWRGQYWQSVAADGAARMLTELSCALPVLALWGRWDRDLEGMVEEYEEQLGTAKEAVAGVRPDTVANAHTVLRKQLEALDTLDERVAAHGRRYNPDAALLAELNQLREQRGDCEGAWRQAVGRVNQEVAKRQAAAAEVARQELERQRLFAPEFAELKVAGRDWGDLDGNLILYRQDLAAGQIVISGRAVTRGVPLAKVEITVDNGATWLAAAGIDPFRASFFPTPDTWYTLGTALTTREGAKFSTPGQGTVRFMFTDVRADQIVRTMLEAISDACRNQNRQQIVALLADDFSCRAGDAGDIDRALNDEFRKFRNERLQITQNAAQPSRRGQIVASVSWRKTADNEHGVRQEKAGQASLTLIDEDGAWRLLTISGANFLVTFGATDDEGDRGGLPAPTDFSIMNQGDMFFLRWRDPACTGDFRVRIYRGQGAAAALALWSTVNKGTEHCPDRSRELTGSPAGTRWYYRLTTYDPLTRLESEPTDTEEVTKE